MDGKNKESGKSGKASANRLLLTGIIFLVVFCVSGYFLLRYYEEYRKQKELECKIAALESSAVSGMTDGNASDDGSTGENAGGNATADGNVSGETRRNHQVYKDVNHDYIGFLTIPDTNIEYPVVHRDNTYYLNHDFYGEKSRHGTIFLDQSCDGADPVILIHGHHMKDKTMFGTLNDYKREAFRDGHRKIYLDLGNGNQTYVVFGAALVDLTQKSFFRYEQLPQTEKERTAYLQKLQDTSFWFDEHSIQECSGQIMVLSTCEYATEDQRLIIAAVLYDKEYGILPENE